MDFITRFEERKKRSREKEREKRERETDRKIDLGGRYTGTLYAALARDAGIVSATFPNQLFTDSLRTIVFHRNTSRLSRSSLFFSNDSSRANENAISA